MSILVTGGACNECTSDPSAGYPDNHNFFFLKKNEQFRLEKYAYGASLDSLTFFTLIRTNFFPYE